MIKNSNMPAMPIFKENGVAEVARHVLANNEPMTIGLTKREYFAAAAMQGILSCDVDACISTEACVKLSVEHADALLVELEKEAK